MKRIAWLPLLLLVATLLGCRAQPELQTVTPGDQRMPNSVQDESSDTASVPNEGNAEQLSTNTEPGEEAELTEPPAEGNSEPTAVAFTPYPKLQRLCEQRVYAGPGSDIREIHWTLDASTDELEQVLAHYRALSGQSESSGEDGVRFDFGNGLRVAVFSRAQRKAHPSCEVEPSKAEQSLVLTSQAR
ncbi:MAG: hypothetical protein RBU37_15985 [Myxococcota bacterium]|jgi:hypothetical protein|nr:hypothetical protein [Myxococcota bacterium]